MNKKILIISTVAVTLTGIGFYKAINIKKEENNPPELWSTADMPDLTSKVAIVTGANNGIGYETAKALAEKGANVIMACRNLEKATAVKSSILQEQSNANLAIIQLDLANLASVREFANTFKETYDRLDILVNNAGIMLTPFATTKDGFEMQFGTNHLGHFALTGLLLDTLLATPHARVVNVSSSSHRASGRTIDFDNLNSEKSYNATRAYAQSKLANLLFTLGLNQHFAKNNADAMAVASHPGWTVTGLQHSVFHNFSFVSRVIGQPVAMGALPSLYAATASDVEPNDYYGPSDLMEMRGSPKRVGRSGAAKDSELAQRLWVVSEELTGVYYN